jgi:hypothetical protein
VSRLCYRHVSAVKWQRAFTDEDNFLVNANHLRDSTSLRSLTLSFGPFSRSATITYHTRILLSQITSPSIEVIKLRVTRDTMEELERVDWNILGQLFSQPQFTRLRAVEFRIGGVDKADWVAVRSMVEARLSECTREISLNF